MRLLVLAKGSVEALKGVTVPKREICTASLTT